MVLTEISLSSTGIKDLLLSRYRRAITGHLRSCYNLYPCHLLMLAGHRIRLETRGVLWLETAAPSTMFQFIPRESLLQLCPRNAHHHPTPNEPAFLSVRWSRPVKTYVLWSRICDRITSKPSSQQQRWLTNQKPNESQGRENRCQMQLPLAQLHR